MSGEFDNPFDRPIIGTPLTPETHIEMDQDMQVLLLMQIADNLRAVQNQPVASLPPPVPEEPKYCGKFRQP
jgi:hypothetical protein